MTIRTRFWLALQLTAMALGMAGFSHSVGAATIVFGSTSAQGFGAHIESKDSLSAVRAAYQCATGNQLRNAS